MRRSSPVTVRAFAKINLDLRILGLLPDGYHEVRTVLQSLRLHDSLTFTPARGRFAIACDVPGVPTDARNLIWRAAALLDQAIRGRRGGPTGVRVTLAKRIPAEAGLGGGSSDAAATLLALSTLWGLDLDLPTLLRLGARLGADVPFFLSGGTALGAGRGDDISPLREPPRVSVVLVKPAFGVSTPDAYRWHDEDGPGRAGRPRRRLPAGWPAWAASVRNDLEPPVVRRHPEVGGWCGPRDRPRGPPCGHVGQRIGRVRAVRGRRAGPGGPGGPAPERLERPGAPRPRRGTPLRASVGGCLPAVLKRSYTLGLRPPGVARPQVSSAGLARPVAPTRAWRRRLRVMGRGQAVAAGL
ncbi:MAG: 4-(cytidine 5'-diphospho)-2-C-methyl-D-erythritol kinase [Vicinamibacterales bacterium]